VPTRVGTFALFTQVPRMGILGSSRLQARLGDTLGAGFFVPLLTRVPLPVVIITTGPF
jgi:hypothetical protein